MGPMIPALLMRTLTGPKVASASATTRRQSAREAASALTKWAFSPSSAAIFSPASSLMSVITTLAPSATKWRAWASPMPCEAPVMMAIFPSNRPMLILSSRLAKASHAENGQRFHGQAIAEPLVHQPLELQRQGLAGVPAGEERLLGDRAGHLPGPVQQPFRGHDLVDGAVLLGGPGVERLAGEEEVAAPVGAQHVGPDHVGAVAGDETRREVRPVLEGGGLAGDDDVGHDGD